MKKLAIMGARGTPAIDIQEAGKMDDRFLKHFY